MSDQSQTTSPPPSETVLCKMGCGFFGNQATGGCCSKCWRDNQKKEDVAVVQSAPAKKPVMVEKPSESEPLAEEKKEESEVKNTQAESAPTKKKKKKKQSYKNMMAGMMHSSPDKDVEKEKEALRKVTGGGAFTKIEKI